MQRRCANCHGQVALTRATFTIPHPHNPDTTIQVSGLGTWRCTNGCPNRLISIKVYSGPGKEADRGSIVRGHNFIHGLDLADDAVTERIRRRSPKVEYGAPRKREAHATPQPAQQEERNPS